MSFYCDSIDDEFLSGSVGHCYCSYYSYPNVSHFPYVYPVFEPDYNLGLGPKDKPIAKCRYGKYPCTCCEKCHRGEKLRFAESDVKKHYKDAFTETDPVQNKGVCTGVSSECDADNEAMLVALRNIKSCQCESDKPSCKSSPCQDPPDEIQKKPSLISLGSTRSRSPSILKTSSRLSVSSQGSTKLNNFSAKPKCPGPRARKIRKCPGPRKLKPPEEAPLVEKSPSPVEKSPSTPPSPPPPHHKHHDHSSKLIKRLKAIDTLKNLSSLIATHPVVMF